LAYVFDPINNTLIDDEDKSLGNKFALLDSELEKAIKELNEKFGPGTVQQGTQGIPPPPIKTPQAIFEFEERMKGRMAEGGRVNFAAAGLALPVLSYPVSYGLATLFGLSTAGGAKVLGDRVTNHIKNNPEILNDPRFKAAALSFGINVPGYIAPDADEMEREAEKIREMTKPTGFPAETEDMPIKTGETTPPEIDTKESFPAELEKLPFREEFPMETQKLPIIFEQKKLKEEDTMAVHKDRNKIIVGGRDRTKEYAKNYKGFYKKLNLPKANDILSISEKTTEIKFKPEIVKDRVKNLKDQKIIKYKDSYTVEELMNIIGAEYSNTSSPNFVKKIGATPIITETGRLKYNFKDFYNKLLDFSKNKELSGRPLTEYETLLKNESGFVNKQSDRRKVFEQSLDPARYKLLLSRRNTRSSIMNEMGLEKDYSNRANEVDHGPYPLDLIMDKNFSKDFEKKFLSMQNETLKSKTFNQALMKNQGSYNEVLDVYKKYLNKKIKNKDELAELKNAINKEIKIKNTEEKIGKELNEEGKIVKTKVTLPKIGEKFTIDNINIDMSSVNPEFIVGNINAINDNAQSFKNLNKKEKTEYLNNLIEQDIKELSEFYSELTDDDGNKIFSKSDIKEFIEDYRDGVNADFKGVEGRTFSGLKYASGGGVEITPLPRANFGNGGAAGADENFAAELEYFLTNPEAEIPKMQTYKETMNPVQILNDIIDPRNYPYYADVLARSGLRVGEFGVRFLPAVGKLISDLIRKPAFKITGTGKNNYVQDYTDILPSNIKGTGIFTEFLNNITPTATEKFIGLDELIKKEEQKQKDRGSTIGPKVFADTMGLGVEVTAPIFPGLKFLRAYAANRNLPVNNTTQKILEKEINEVLESRGMNRREFLQATGAGATIVLAKMLGISDDMGRTAKVAEKVSEKATTSVSVPPYFFKLVEKIKKHGKKFEPEYDPRVENNMTYGGFELRENMTTGEITIGKVKEGEFAGPNDKMYSGVMSDELISYKPGESFLAKDGKYYKAADEYEEFTARPDEDGKMKDVEPGLDSIEEIIEILPNQLKMSELEKAGYNVDAFPDSIKRLLIDDLQKTN
tara:strand:- start:218 stop:3475 length:3258 start_codon:yes stop_codon:yes gene_type:complete